MFGYTVRKPIAVYRQVADFRNQTYQGIGEFNSGAILTSKPIGI